MCPQSTLRTQDSFGDTCAKRWQTSTQVSPFIAVNVNSICTIHRTGTEKGNSGKRQHLSIAAVPMPDYSSSPQTGGGCDLTRSTYVFPCIQDARHWLVVQLGPGQRKTEHCKIQHGFQCVRQCSMLF